MKQQPAFEPGVDYLYCAPCQTHVACRETEPGAWEVECPLCEGECGLCDCSLRKRCFGSPEGPQPLPMRHLRVVKP